MDTLKVWGNDIPLRWLSVNEQLYLEDLPSSLPTVQWVWDEMDRVWNSLFLDNRKILSSQDIASFYSHPVWLMNGLFTQSDPISVKHRVVIAEYLNSLDAIDIADYGGGYGEMALILRKKIIKSNVTIIEPFPSQYGQKRLESDERITIIPNLKGKVYDAVIAQDVLEHVEDPVELACQLISSVKTGGVLVFANCFFPYIQCHLPSTFHLRHTFPFIMKKMGLRYIGTIRGAYHAQVFLKISESDIKSARQREEFAKKISPFLNNSFSTLISKVKRRVLKR